MNIDFDYDLSYEKGERRSRVIKYIIKTLIWIIIIGAAVTGGWAVTRFCIEKTNVVGNSMEGTLFVAKKIDQYLIAIKNDAPERFDVIVFEKNGKEHSYYGVRRVIGLPGERVQIINGRVYINGEALDEPMNVAPMKIAGLAEEEIVLDEDEFFVLGDNRNDSEDSRFTSMGNVLREEIIGRAWFRLNKFGFISKMNLKENS